MAPSSKVPIYPRPVSPLSAESFQLECQDVIYGTSQPSSDDDPYARAAKRRRIEKLGEQYLRGDGLHILSAGLKGPFDSDWKNPWTKRRRHTNRAVAEIPETVGKPVKKLQAQRFGCAKAENNKVEEWLRRNSAFSDIQIEDQISPTPLRAKVVDFRDTTPVKPIPKPTNDASYGSSCRLDSNFETHQIVMHSGSHDRDVQSLLKPPDIADRPLHYEVTNNTRIDRRAWVSHAANADRAEFAALNSKRRGLQVAPSSTMMSPFEYRRVSDGAQKPRKFKEVADQLQEENESMAPPVMSQPRTLHTKDDNERPDEPKRLDATSDRPNFPQAVVKSTSSAAPALSTNTSRASVANLPSAQPRSLDVPAPSTNNLAFEEQALEQQLDSVNATEEPPRNKNGDEPKAAPVTKHVHDHESNLTMKENQTPHLPNKVLSAADQTRLPTTVAKEGLGPNTQDMLADMSPLIFSTVKRATTGFRRPATPITATKRRTEKSGKPASFAQSERFSSDSSQGSLKASLRVSKGGSSVAIGKENKLISVSEEDISKPLFDHFTRPAKDSLLPAASPKGLKSALKPSGLPVQTVPFPSTKGSTSTGVDGGQKVAVLGDDTFDLDGAIDDLGSYLGTWDAEKEASSLGIGM